MAAAQRVPRGRARPGPVLRVVVGDSGALTLEPDDEAVTSTRGGAGTIVAPDDVIQQAPDLGAQRQIFLLASAALRRGGELVVQVDRIEGAGGPRVDRADDAVLRIASSERDPVSGRWRIVDVALDLDGLVVQQRTRLATPWDTLDRMAAWAGLVVDERRRTSGRRSTSCTTVYRRA